jgi:hypothetical protein
VLRRTFSSVIERVLCGDVRDDGDLEFAIGDGGAPVLDHGLLGAGRPNGCADTRRTGMGEELVDDVLAYMAVAAGDEDDRRRRDGGHRCDVMLESGC